MARRIEITHTYVAVLPSNAESQDQIRVLGETAMRIMENHISQMEGVLNLRSDWKLMPKYDPPELREMTVEEFEEKAGLFHDDPVEADIAKPQIESGQ